MDEGEKDVFRARVYVLVSMLPLTQQGDERHPLNVKLELTSDNDIFFLYQTVVNEDKYKALQEQ